MRALAAIALVVLGCHGSEHVTNPDDDSTAPPVQQAAPTKFPLANAPVSLTGPGDLHGKVDTVQPDARGDSVTYTVAYSGAAAGQLELTMPSFLRNPVHAGDDIHVVLSSSAQGRMQIQDFAITDGAGLVLVAVSNTGRADLTPGWTATRAAERSKLTPPREMCPACTLVRYGETLVHAGRKAQLAFGRWRELVTPDGKWLVAAESFATTGTMVPDTLPSGTWFAIVRER